MKEANGLFALDIVIDHLTPCLIKIETGEVCETEVSKVTAKDVSLVQLEDWNFDWQSLYQKHNIQLLKLTVEGSSIIEGLIAFEKMEGYVEIHLVESAPTNVGSRIYSGVGAHLFAIACKKSIDYGFEGYVAFNAKTNLIEHYMKVLNAESINARGRMVIDEQAALQLTKVYFQEGDVWNE
ncbi:hypothetical protein PTI45_03067 [Paenibacillus nuruki]|uniref:N-acetyltransferase domain-containing protein n=1 Tax=Paenibacillus nuruki TaxID=1886670 RepID=A0A1E3L2W0_9BACL|nr:MULTISPECIES: hypothetical protein [Paenibacillus]ODP27505.1 hypothetical protein PTI45_03067 [Paenibacillus nuruki]TKJ87271.1 hypothetical protein PaeCFBP13512_18800 [Paenibacillus sp. CFBP13512]